MCSRGHIVSGHGIPLAGLTFCHTRPSYSPSIKISPEFLVVRFARNHGTGGPIGLEVELDNLDYCRTQDISKRFEPGVCSWNRELPKLGVDPPSSSNCLDRRWHPEPPGPRGMGGRNRRQATFQRPPSQPTSSPKAASFSVMALRGDERTGSVFCFWWIPEVRHPFWKEW